MDQPDDHIEYPIDGTLDLHQFSPKETKEVVREYIAACLEKGIDKLRIVHGKGIGVQREIVRSVLKDHPAVKSFRHEGGSGGGWGATVVDLKLPDHKIDT
jgi:DNA-nicking Smr family endonuclease